MWQQKYRMRWVTEDRSIQSGWTPHVYPSFSEIRNNIIDKKIKIELEHLETYEKIERELVNVADVISIKYLNIVVDGGFYGIVAIGLNDGTNTEWHFCDGTTMKEANK